MERRYRVSIPFADRKRGEDIHEDQVTEEDLLFNRVVPYNYSAPPPQKDKETPPPISAKTQTSKATVREE